MAKTIKVKGPTKADAERGARQALYEHFVARLGDSPTTALLNTASAYLPPGGTVYSAPPAVQRGGVWIATVTIG